MTDGPMTPFKDAENDDKPSRDDTQFDPKRGQRKGDDDHVKDVADEIAQVDKPIGKNRDAEEHQRAHLDDPDVDTQAEHAAERVTDDGR